MIVGFYFGFGFGLLAGVVLSGLLALLLWRRLGDKKSGGTTNDGQGAEAAHVQEERRCKIIEVLEAPADEWKENTWRWPPRE